MKVYVTFYYDHGDGDIKIAGVYTLERLLRGLMDRYKEDNYDIIMDEEWQEKHEMKIEETYYHY